MFGGHVGCLSALQSPGNETLVEAANKLAPGALSDAVETPRALYLLRLDGKLDAAHLERDARLQIARNLYARFAADQAMRAFAGELVRQTKAGQKLEDVTRTLSDELAHKAAPAAKTPAPAANKSAPTPAPALLAADRPRFEVSSPFPVSGNPLPELEPKEPIASRAFSLAGPDAVDERPIETSTGLVVLQLKEKMPVSHEDFEKEKWGLIRMLQQAKGDEALTRYVADLRKRAGSKLKIDERFSQEKKGESVED